jgi:hypothetical protein
MNPAEQQEKDAAWLKGYKQGAADARADYEIGKEKAIATERQRILTLIQSLSQANDSPVIQQVIELIYKK